MRSLDKRWFRWGANQRCSFDSASLGVRVRWPISGPNTWRPARGTMRARCGVVARSACKQAISRRLTPTPSRWSDKPGGLEVPSSNLGAPMKRKALLRRGFLVIGTRLPPCPQWSHRAQTSPREPSLLTRERFFAVFDPDDVAGRAGAEASWDLQYAGRVGDHVDPDLVEGDRQGLVTIADPSSGSPICKSRTTVAND